MDSFHSASKSSQYASAASPGVNLERGAYRMRAPSIRPLASLHLQERTRPALEPRPAQQRANGRVTFLLLLLVAACMTSFGMAYYLFTTRWDIRTFQGTHASSNATREATGHEPGMSMNPTQKYLTYFPHSGFHNQRIALENAFVLAYASNRTLLIPPIRLGSKPIRYVEYDTLSQYHELSGREGLKHCLLIPAYVSRPLECSHYSESSYLSWTPLVDFSSLYPRVPHRHTPSMSPTWSSTYLNLTSADIYTLKDESPYQYRFVDAINSASQRPDKYQEVVHISCLLSIEQTLLQLGTLFGTTRLVLADPNNLFVQDTVRRQMAFTDQDLLRVANAISQSLGNSFSAVHLRLGDGSFQSKNEMIVNKIWLKLLQGVIGLSLSEICQLALQCGADVSDICDQEEMEIGRGLPRMKQPPVAFYQNHPLANVTCRGLQHQDPQLERLNRPLFVATDIPSPGNHSLLSVFRHTFPCIFFLGDFQTELKPLEEIRSPYDGVYLYPFILPFIDALVASKALNVVGTDKSTFSKFVKEILWVPSEAGTEGT
jgi:hypothetical protein